MTQKRILTSSFANAGRHPDRVNIAREPPGAYQGPHCAQLMPPEALLVAYMNKAMTWQDYRHRFQDLVLGPLDGARILTELGPSAVLLCWCPPGGPCHRRIVADWLERTCGIVVAELDAPSPAWSLDVR